MTSLILAPNPDHALAATSFRRARNALLHARMSPWTAERELDSAEFWVRSGHHHRRMAAVLKPVPAPARTWVETRFDTWDAELAALLASPAAIAAEVE